MLTPIQLKICLSALQLGHKGEGCSCKRPLADFDRSGSWEAVDSVKTVMTRALVCQLGVLGVEW